MTTQDPRLLYSELAPKPFRALLALTSAVQTSSLGHTLVDLVFLRVSQINGCAFCIDMHWRDLIEHGEKARRLNDVAGWRESPFFDARERAALKWAELVTAIPQRDPDDAEFAELRRHFSDVEIAELGFAIVGIHAWNRLNVSFRTPIPAAA
jgi:AhpD family alkylhydroperoxidase